MNQIELFQYSSERIDTGIKEVDAFESLKTFSTNSTRNSTSRVLKVTMTNNGSGYTSPPTVTFTSGTGVGAAGTAVLGTGSNTGKVMSVTITEDGQGYQVPPAISFIGGGGANAAAVATLEIDIDKVDSFGDNNSFKEEANDIIFSESNPFGEVGE